MGAVVSVQTIDLTSGGYGIEIGVFNEQRRNRTEGL